jgi:hypothetical protein
MVEIKTGDIPCCIFVSNVSHHQNIKNNFLNSIKDTPRFSIKDSNLTILNTDYYLVDSFRDITYNYSSFILPILEEHNNSLTKFLNYYTKIKVGLYWFQQYSSGDFHSWHHHPGSVFSNIYYVDLPEKSVRTKFRFLGEEFEIAVEEGQILTFPSFLEHCSPPNSSDSIKTIISFNSN